MPYEGDGMGAPTYSVGPGGQLTTNQTLTITDPPAGAGGGAGGGGEPEFGMSEEEKELIRAITEMTHINVESARAQLDSYRRLLPQFEDTWSAQASLTKNQAQLQRYLLPYRRQGFIDTMRGFDELADDKFLNQWSRNVMGDAMSGKGLIRDETAEPLIQQVYDERRRTGTAALRQSAEDMAAGRGMNLTDTPIGGDYFLRNLSEFESGLGAEQANTTLGVAQQQQQFRMAAAQFQRNLQLSANAQRGNLATGGATSGGGPSLPTVSSPDSGASGALNTLAGNRQAAATFRLGQMGLQNSANIAAGNNAAQIQAANIAARRPERNFWDYATPLIGAGLGAAGQWASGGW